jgi:hypothetical protein
MNSAELSIVLRQMMLVVDGALLIVRTVIYRMAARRIFGKRIYPTIALLGFGAFAFLFLYKRRSGSDTILQFIPVYVMGLCLIVAVVLCVEVAWFIARLRTQPSTLRLPRLEWSMALAILACISSIGLMNQALASPPIGPRSWQMIVLLPCAMFLSLTILFVATRRGHQLVALALVLAVLVVANQWNEDYEAWFRPMRPFRYFSPWNAWLQPVSLGLWLFVISFSARGLAYGAVAALGITAFERTTGVQFLSLCYESSLLTALVLLVATCAVLAVVLHGNTASRFRRWGLATLTMRDLSTVNQVFNAIALDPQRVIGRRLAVEPTHFSKPLSEKLTSVLMRRSWTRSLHFAPLLVLVLVCTRIVGGDQTSDPLNAVGWGFAAAILPMLIASVNIVCLTTDRGGQNLIYLTPGWPVASEFNRAIAKFVVYGALADAGVISLGFLAMLPFSVNPQYWLIAIGSCLSASFIAISLTLHKYLRESPTGAVFAAASSIVCFAPIVALLYLVNRRVETEVVVLGLIVVTAFIATFRTWRFARGEWAIPVGLRFRPT